MIVTIIGFIVIAVLFVITWTVVDIRLDKLRLRVRVLDLKVAGAIAFPHKEPEPELEVKVPSFVAGPSCVQCYKPVDDLNAYSIALEIPLTKYQPPMPVTIWIHRNHAEAWPDA